MVSDAAELVVDRARAYAAARYTSGAGAAGDALVAAVEALPADPAKSDPAPGTEWRQIDYDNKAATAPPPDAMVWVVEEFYEQGVTVGLFDGFTFRVLPSGSDDCSVSWWAPMERPQGPAGG
jgi:hypothetical protein